MSRDPEAGRPGSDLPPHPARPILIVEDNRVNVLVLRSMLRRFGYEPLVATDGSEGVAMAAAFSPRLVLMDINMPGMDGIAAAAAMRDPAGDCSPAIVAVTADITEGMRAACRAAGFDGLLQKPLVLADLIATVRKWVGEPEPGVIPAPPLSGVPKRRLG